MAALLVLDLGVLHNPDREIGICKGQLLSAGYSSICLLFGAWLWWLMGAHSGTEYFTGYLIEKSLSMDNIFVIFSVGLIGKTPPAMALGVTFGLIAAGVAHLLCRTPTSAGPNTLAAGAVTP